MDGNESAISNERKMSSSREILALFINCVHCEVTVHPAPSLCRPATMTIQTSGRKEPQRITSGPQGDTIRSSDPSRVDPPLCIFPSATAKRMIARRRLWSIHFALSIGQHLGIRAMSTSSASTRIAVGQLRTSNNKMRSLLDAAYCARRAKEEGAKGLFLPENFGFFGTSPQETVERAESLVGGTRNQLSATQALLDTVSGSTVVDWKDLQDSGSVSLLDGLATIASASGLWISACMHTSGAPVSVEGKERVYNTHLIIDQTGSIKATYHKIHLFDVSIPNEVELRESNTTAPGKEIVVCDSPFGKLGLSTCYDIRFPQLYSELVQRGAEVLLVPSAFTVPTGQAHWHTLLRARAIESQCYVIAAAQYGVHNSQRVSYGHSLVVDPWGTVLTDAGGMDSSETTNDPPTIVCADIDLNRLREVRRRMPVQEHRKNAPYA